MPKLVVCMFLEPQHAIAIARLISVDKNALMLSLRTDRHCPTTTCMPSTCGYSSILGGCALIGPWAVYHWWTD